MLHSHSPKRIRNLPHLTSPAAGPSGGDEPEDLPHDQEAAAVPAKRLLLVEDEFLLSALLVQDLQAAGYEVLGPYATLASAMAAARSGSFDAAILDINLKGELVYPLAEELTRQQIPFLFLSGYALVNMPERFRSHPRIAKPASWTLLLKEIQAMLRHKT